VTRFALASPEVPSWKPFACSAWMRFVLLALPAKKRVLSPASGPRALGPRLTKDFYDHEHFDDSGFWRLRATRRPMRRRRDLGTRGGVWRGPPGSRVMELAVSRG
jgi:hypothetical protein